MCFSVVILCLKATKSDSRVDLVGRQLLGGGFGRPQRWSSHLLVDLTGPPEKTTQNLGSGCIARWWSPAACIQAFQITSSPIFPWTGDWKASVILKEPAFLPLPSPRSRLHMHSSSSASERSKFMPNTIQWLPLLWQGLVPNLSGLITRPFLHLNQRPWFPFRNALDETQDTRRCRA